MLDANHPLAGLPLNFEVRIVEVRSATVDELKHGHMHGEDDEEEDDDEG